MVVTGAAGWFVLTVVASRDARRSAVAALLETTARPVTFVSGSGSRTTRTSAGCVGSEDACFGPHAIASVPASAARIAHARELRGIYGNGCTQIASVVPLTPTMAAGVSRRIESGASLAIRPDTYAATPRMNFTTSPRLPLPGAYTKRSSRTSLAGPRES